MATVIAAVLRSTPDPFRRGPGSPLDVRPGRPKGQAPRPARPNHPGFSARSGGRYRGQTVSCCRFEIA